MPRGFFEKGSFLAIFGLRWCFGFVLNEILSTISYELLL